MCLNLLNIPHPDNPKVRNNVPCGKCLDCLRNKRNEWTFRVTEEQRTSKTSKFITLTYSDDKVPTIIDEGKTTLDKTDLQKFIKKLRYHNSLIWPHQVRYYAVGEYGTTTERPHYHLILFNVHQKVINKLNDIWKKGMADIKNANPATIRYVTKYLINKTGDYDIREKPFAIMSKNPAIGYNYINRIGQYHAKTKNLYVTIPDGNKLPIPRYYKDKLFSRDERAKLTEELQFLQDKEYINSLNRAIETNHPFFKDEMEGKENSLRKLRKNLNKKNIL